MRPVWLLFLAACGARSGLEPPDLCNGIDDDGDGLVDEDAGTITCGIGACAKTISACFECTPFDPGVEVCNGIDDDCDGAIDEGLGLVRVAGPYDVDPALWYLARAALVPTDDGLLVTYATSFDGLDPVPNLLWAVLDPDGKPTGAKGILTDRNATNGPRMAPAPGGFAITYCGRFGFEDRAASGLVSASGVYTDHGLRTPPDNFCGAGDPGLAWTGERLLFGWIDNSDMRVFLDRAPASGASVESSVLSPTGDLSNMPRFAKLGPRTVLTYGEGIDHLRVHRLDASGHDVGAPIAIQPPLEGGIFRDAQVEAQAPHGFLVLAPNRFEPGLFRIRLDADGAVIGTPDLVPEVDFYVDLSPALLARPGGGYLFASSGVSDVGDEFGLVYALDAEGNVTDALTTNEDPFEPWFGWPALAARDGRIFLAYTGPTATPDHPGLRVVELGCAP